MGRDEADRECQSWLVSDREVSRVARSEPPLRRFRDDCEDEGCPDGNDEFGDEARAEDSKVDLSSSEKIDRDPFGRLETEEEQQLEGDEECGERQAAEDDRTLVPTLADRQERYDEQPHRRLDEEGMVESGKQVGTGARVLVLVKQSVRGPVAN